MDFFKELLIIESEQSSQKEIDYVIGLINKLYTEWKALGRRKNAVDIITTTANKLSTIDPSIVDKLHEATRIKLAALIIRCFDIPYWKDVYEREKLYKKLINIIKTVENVSPNVTSGGMVKDIIMTRLSSAISNKSENKSVFVTYEPTSKSYLKYIFGNEIPEKIYKMQSLGLPLEFDQLVSILEINHNKAVNYSMED